MWLVLDQLVFGRQPELPTVIETQRLYRFVQVCGKLLEHCAILQAIDVQVPILHGNEQHAAIRAHEKWPPLSTSWRTHQRS
jgi:hypothetical protein